MKVIEQHTTMIDIISMYLHSFKFAFLHLNKPHTVSDLITLKVVGFVAIRFDSVIFI